HKDMTDNEITDFRLFKIDGEGKSADEWEKILRGKTRYNDSVCLGNDGNIYILTTQVDDQGEEIIIGRFERAGIKCEKIEDMYPIEENTIEDKASGEKASEEKASEEKASEEKTKEEKTSEDKSLDSKVVEEV
ncbi:MAG: hypothetical protein K6G87_10435, partial [Butyrivibrio sp.]|uniref:hypothetical protein n=1 Tax=Butyrivibrio sp. TaxID=28121 RepID=UPI0025E60981